MTDQSLYRFIAPSFIPFTIVGHAAALLGATALAVWSLQRQGDAGDLWFWPVWLSFAAALTWFDLFKIAFELKITDQRLKWRTPLRSGEVPCDQILTVRNVIGSWPWPLVRIRTSARPSVYVYGRRSLREFADALQLQNPRIEVDTRSYRSWRWGSLLDPRSRDRVR